MRGRKNIYQEYDNLFASLKGKTTKRPVYCRGVGVSVGHNSVNAWIKLKLTHDTVYKGFTRRAGGYIEMKLGSLESFTWGQLEDKRKYYQGKIDRQELLEDKVVPTFGEYVDIYMNRVNLVEQGRRNTEITLREFLVPEFGNKTINTITSHQIDLWQSKRLRDVSPSTVQRQKTILNAILNMALRDELLDINPINKSQSIKIPEHQPRYLNKGELNRLLELSVEVNDWLQDFILLAVSTGLRRGELLSLRWKEVHIKDTGEVYLRFNSGKTGKVRIVPCTSIAVGVIDRCRSGVKSSEDRLFDYSVSALNSSWSKLKRLSGISDVRIQDLRVTCASYAANEGIPIKTLASIMGHSTTRMLEKHYVGVADSEIMRASSIIDKSFNKILRG